LGGKGETLAMLRHLAGVTKGTHGFFS
jgi:hypothetical protein